MANSSVSSAAAKVAEILSNNQDFMSNCFPAMIKAAQYGESSSGSDRVSIPPAATAYFNAFGSLNQMGMLLFKEILKLKPEWHELFIITHPVPAKVLSYQESDPETFKAIQKFFTCIHEHMRLKVCYTVVTGNPVNSLMGHMGYLESPSRAKKRQSRGNKKKSDDTDIASLLDNSGVASELGMAVVEAIREKDPDYVHDAARKYEQLREMIDPVGALF
ncbi:MAG: hypothetical protein EBR79_00480 [Proteobacteria bacterium]|nr:hypothetical protein [Pseudomonadota bacterium]NBX86264.1 hypothetical protein [Pseudomonadota bacterium]